jgi:3-oxoacyl-[acyl-carrier protein] reductase
MLLQDRTAIVTGGAAGIGAAIARLFAEQGARVIVFDSDGDGDALKVDVRSRSQVQSAVQEVLRRYGQIDILVNNAGIYPRQEFVSMTEEQWDETVDVNLKGVFHCTQAVASHMIERRSGKIVNVSSINFHKGGKYLTHYTAAKGGVIGLTRAVARELGVHNIHSNCVAPGAIETEREPQFVTSAQVEAMVAQQCLQRRILPIDVARVCLFLASHLSDGMTGQTLTVDGGWLMT